MSDEKSAPVKLSVSKEAFDAAKVMAPNLTPEFVAEHGLDEDYLAKIARGELAPPPTVGPIQSTDLHFVDGMWVNVPHGVKLEDVGKDAISR